MHRFVAVTIALSALSAWADDDWQTLQTAPILVKARPRPGASGVKEIWAEGDIDAQVVDIQGALTDVGRFTRFMPYLVESREFGKREADGSTYVYSKLDMPVLSARDFVHRTWLDRDARTDAAGVFANHWLAVPDKIPQRFGVVRMPISEGSWLVTPKPGGGAHVVYRFAVDPGGMIPTFASNMSNTNGILDTFKNVGTEAKRREALRAAASTSNGADSGALTHDAGR